jgi:hypothetical protein
MLMRFTSFRILRQDKARDKAANRLGLWTVPCSAVPERSDETPSSHVFQCSYQRRIKNNKVIINTGNKIEIRGPLYV